MLTQPSTPDLQTRDLTCRKLTLRHESLDEQSRSFEAVVATETPSVVYDYRTHEHIDEILVAEGGDFPRSIVLLDDHQRYSGVNSVMGTATDFRQQGRQWVGRGIVGQAAEGNTHREQAWMDLRDGHIRAVSIGYIPVGFVDIPAGQTQKVNGTSYTADERTLRITTEWRVHELSLTPIGADSEALIRNHQGAPPKPQRSYFAR